MKINIENVSKKYAQNKYGLKDFSLSIGDGILGLLGPNGAGKSTLLKMIATISRPTEGVILLNETDITKNPGIMRRQLGFLPQDFGVYPNLNAYEFLAYMAAMKGVGGPGLKNKIFQLIEGLNLNDAANKPIGTYSGGMKQRIGIAQCLLNDPKIVIFDEPTVGLDPEERVRFRNLISDMANNCIVILSSHIVSDIDTIADEVVVMKNGGLIAQGDQATLIKSVEGKVFITRIAKEQLADLKKTCIVVHTKRSSGLLEVRYIADQSVGDSISQEANLEDAYLYLINQK